MLPPIPMTAREEEMYFSWMDGPDEGAVCPACDDDTLVHDKQTKGWYCENDECDHEEDDDYE